MKTENAKEYLKKKYSHLSESDFFFDKILSIFLKDIVQLMEEYRNQPNLSAINALSQKMYGCDYSEVHLPERRAELLEKYLGIEREAENEVSPRE